MRRWPFKRKSKSGVQGVIYDYARNLTARVLRHRLDVWGKTTKYDSHRLHVISVSEIHTPEGIRYSVQVDLGRFQRKED